MLCMLTCCCHVPLHVHVLIYACVVRTYKQELGKTTHAHVGHVCFALSRFPLAFVNCSLKIVCFCKYSYRRRCLRSSCFHPKRTCTYNKCRHCNVSEALAAKSACLVLSAHKLPMRSQFATSLHTLYRLFHGWVTLLSPMPKDGGEHSAA